MTLVGRTGPAVGAECILRRPFKAAALLEFVERSLTD
jgi:hypothetical protein